MRNSGLETRYSEMRLWPTVTGIHMTGLFKQILPFSQNDTGD